MTNTLTLSTLYASARQGAYGGQMLPYGVQTGSGTMATPVDQATIARVTLYGPDGKPLPLDAFRSPVDFGPGVPLIPRLEGDISPREFQYLPGFNLIPQPRTEERTRTQDFAALRFFSMAFPYSRIAINYRKQQIAGMEWDIGLKEDPKSKKLKDENSAEIETIKDFWRTPNRIDNVPTGKWLKQYIEEILVTDATCFFVMPDRAGTIHSLVQIDGATVKPNIDEFGHVVSFQQILYGYPTTMYATFNAAGKELEPGSLVYLIENPKVDNVYGTPPSEEILPLIDLGLARLGYQTSWYREGTVPDGFIEAPPNMEVKTIREWQNFIDDTIAGNDKKRHAIRFMPAGSKWTQVMKGLNYSKDEEEMVISAVCAMYGVPRSLYVSTVNRATGEMQRDEQQDTAFKPLKISIKAFLDQVIAAMGFDKYEWIWVDTPAGNEKEISEARLNSITGGWRTVDEIRAEDGLDPLPEPAPVPVQPGMAGAPAPGQKPAAAKPGQPGGEGQKPGEAPEQTEKVDGQIAAWRRFALNRIAKGRHLERFDAQLPQTLRKSIILGLADAQTEDDVKLVFAKAETLAAKRKKYQQELLRAVKANLASQKANVLQHAASVLAAV